MARTAIADIQMLAQAGKLADALATCRRHLKRAPASVELLIEYGTLRTRMGDAAGALEPLRKAEKLRPTAQGAAALSAALLTLGQLAEAEAALIAAITRAPQNAEWWADLGRIRAEAGNPEGALAALDEALKIDPKSPSGLYNYGFALSRLGRVADALPYLEACARVMPRLPEVWAALAWTHGELGRHDAALAAAEQALALHPGHAGARLSRGSTYFVLGRLTDAIADFQAVCQMDPGNLLARSNLAVALHNQGDNAGAEAVARAVLTRAPDHAAAHLILGSALMCQDRMLEAWEELEWRWRSTAHTTPVRQFPQPQWCGEDLQGRSILVHLEQGLGDTIMFARYLPLLLARGARVVLETRRRLHHLFRHWDIEMRGEDDMLPITDYQCALASLPRGFRTDLSNVPADIPYLSADPARVAAWRDRLPGTGLRIGIAWQGNPNGTIDRGRSLPVGAMAPLAAIPGVTLISLQRGFGTEQLADLPPGMRVETLGDDFDEGPDAFADSAAVMANLDLIITSDTSIPHLAGALGRPVWLALQFASEWRWLWDRADSPWYPTMRLFRQTTQGDWDGVFAAMADALRGMAAGAAPSPVATPALTTTPPSVAPEVPILASPGELLDKITILEIKEARIRTAEKRRNVAHELALLRSAAAQLPHLASLPPLIEALRTVNARLWDVEDALREHEARQDFGPDFVELARAVYKTNDRRAELKREINLALGSAIIEEKSYGEVLAA